MLDGGVPVRGIARPACSRRCVTMGNDRVRRGGRSAGDGVDSHRQRRAEVGCRPCVQRQVDRQACGGTGTSHECSGTVVAHGVWSIGGGDIVLLWGRVAGPGDRGSRDGGPVGLWRRSPRGARWTRTVRHSAVRSGGGWGGRPLAGAGDSGSLGCRADRRRVCGSRGYRGEMLRWVTARPPHVSVNSHSPETIDTELSNFLRRKHTQRPGCRQSFGLSRQSRSRSSGQLLRIPRNGSEFCYQRLETGVVNP